MLRALQGAAGGGLQPVGQAILADSFPAEKRGMASAVYGIAAVVAPTVGPTLGGWLTDNYDWRWIFLINVPVGAALIMLVIHRSSRTAARSAVASSFSVDWWGFGFVALSLGCLQVVLDRGQDADWFSSPLIATLAIASATASITAIFGFGRSAIAQSRSTMSCSAGRLLAADDLRARGAQRELVGGEVLEEREPDDDQQHRHEPDVQDVEEDHRDDDVQEAEQAAGEKHARREASVTAIGTAFHGSHGTAAGAG